jgi:hypothetical protein
VRTTLTIDDDVAALLEEEQRRSGASFKETVNRALRKGLTSPALPRERFQVKPIDLGVPKGFSFDNISELLDELEGPDRR